MIRYTDIQTRNHLIGSYTAEYIIIESFGVTSSFGRL